MFWFITMVVITSATARFAHRTLDSYPVVSIPNGKMAGRYYTVSGIPIAAFNGIPYAQPPIGDLRFKPPLPAVNWSGIRNTTQDPNICVQSKGLDTVGSEDCLYINVYTPKVDYTNSSSFALLPVMVWIYGGGFNNGDSSYGTYNPNLFMTERVVFVSFNYRLGIFGFISTNDIVAPGNYGLKDQVLALKWVQQNIHTFGGDSAKVTIFGESAGAASVSYLLISPAAKGLFRAAISQSGTALSPWALGRKVKEVTTTIANILFIDTQTSRSMVDGLSKVPYKQLQAVANTVGLGTAIVTSLVGGLYFAPVMEVEHDGAVITFKSHQQLVEGNYNKVPHIIGFNSNEALPVMPVLEKFWYYFISYDLFPQMLVPADINSNHHLTDRQLNEAGNAIKLYYFGTLPIFASKEKFIHYASDILFVYPSNEAAKQQSKHSPVYYYEFSYEGRLGAKNRTDFGVGHAEDLGYLFIGGDETDPIDPKDEITRKRLIKLWTNFAKYLNPTPTNTDTILQNLNWPIAGTNLACLNIGTDLKLEYGPRSKDIGFWDTIYANYGKAPFDTY